MQEIGQWIFIIFIVVVCIFYVPWFGAKYDKDMGDKNAMKNYYWWLIWFFGLIILTIIFSEI